MDATSRPWPDRSLSTGAEDRGTTLLWLPLDGNGAPASLVGGKAAALDRLVGASAPVPRAAALTTDAYRRFVEAAELGPLLAALSQADEERVTNTAAEEVAEAFLLGSSLVTRPIPPGRRSS